MALQKHTQTWVHDNVIHVWTDEAKRGREVLFPLDEEMPYIAFSDGTILKIEKNAESVSLVIEASGDKSHARINEDIGEVAIEIYCESGFSWVLYGKHLEPFPFCY